MSGRRSSRRTAKGREYAVGDMVELHRGGATASGRLVIKLSEEPARWLVTFDHDDLRDEEIPQESLGPILRKGDDSDSGDISTQNEVGKVNQTTKKKTGRGRSNTGGKGSVSGNDSRADSGSEDSVSQSNHKKRRKSVEFSEHNHDDTDSTPPEDASTTGLRSKASDRAKRVRRRQQTIDEDKMAYLEKTNNAKSNGGMNHPPNKKPNLKGGEGVVKIPMLTGTLYLYRGDRRRVAFIRKV
eukprot:Nitzschia sp. Nitz4//scaffold8_size234185//112519//113324//NITZ4_001263-RA/size234185-augustus-gene-0.243-mRNA-1//1//CDS//3329559824//8169//frame0